MKHTGNGDEGQGRSTPPPSASELARRIADSDAASARPPDKQLRAQWNVPHGVKPYIPAWVGVAVLVSILLPIAAMVLALILE